MPLPVLPLMMLALVRMATARASRRSAACQSHSVPPELDGRDAPGAVAHGHGLLDVGAIAVEKTVLLYLR